MQRALVRKEQELDCQRQPKVQRYHGYQEDLARLPLRGAEHRIQVPHEKGGTHTEADGHENPVEDVDGRPADEGHGHPDEVRIAVQGPALEEVGGLGAEVAEDGEEGDRDEEGVAVDETRGAWRKMWVRYQPIYTAGVSLGVCG